MNIRAFLCTLATGAFVAAASGTLLESQAPATLQQDHIPSRALCGNSRDVRLVNGKILTMDPRNSIVSTVNIRDGRIVAVGNMGDQTVTDCTRQINLRGRTVTPGLIDDHVHFVALGRRPGTDVMLDNAASIAELQGMLRDAGRATPSTEFVTSIGGWNALQFQEKRLPTLSDLDAAVPDHGVLLASSYPSVAVTNSMGKAFFESNNVAVGADGKIKTSAGLLRAVFLLKNAMTSAQLLRNTERLQTWAASVGLTTVMDMGSHTFTGTDIDSVGAFDDPSGYDPVLELARDNKLKVRYRLNLKAWDSTAALPELKARLGYSLLDFGGDMLRTSCIGESIWTFDGPQGINSGNLPPAYVEAAGMVAKRGYCYEQHSLTQPSNLALTAAWEKVNATTPIGDLHWRVAHAVNIDKPTIDRLKAIGAGVDLHPTLPHPYRMIVDSGIHVGAGSDGRNVGPVNPWLIMQYMVTGRNTAGVLDNAGQTLTRAEALRLYTASNGWFSKEETVLGSIEIGKFGDVVVLSKDYLDPKQVPDDSIKRITAVLTVVDGRIVYDTGTLGDSRNHSAH